MCVIHAYYLGLICFFSLTVSCSDTAQNIILAVNKMNREQKKQIEPKWQAMEGMS